MALLGSRGYGALAVVSLACVLPAAAQAQSLEEFYRGKQLNMVIGYPTGGSNDIYARAVARHIGRHIPGNPTVIPRNMPGGGSLVAANHVFNIAPKDGTTLSLIAPTIPLEERLGVANVKLKTAEFNWIGRVAPSVNMTFVMSTVPVQTIQDTFKREVLAGRERAQLHGRDLSRGGRQRARREIQAGDGLPELDRVDAGHGARRGRRPFDQPRSRACGASRMAAREEDQGAGAIFAQAASGTPGRSDVVGAGAKRCRSANSQNRCQRDRGREDDLVDATLPGRPHPGAASRLRRDDEGSGVPGGAEVTACRASGRCRARSCRSSSSSLAPFRRRSSTRSRRSIP